MLVTRPVDVMVFFSQQLHSYCLHLYFMVKNLTICVRIAQEISTSIVQMGPKSRKKNKVRRQRAVMGIYGMKYN